MDKEQMLKMVKKASKSKGRKIKKSDNPTLEIGGMSSDVFPEAEIAEKSYWNKSEDLRETIKRIIED